MKQKYFAVLLAALFISIFTCSAKKVSYPKQFETIVSQMEKVYSTCTKDEWDALDGKYCELREQYREEYDSISEEEKSAVGELFGRYAAVQLKRSAGELEHSLGQVADELKKATSEFSSMLEGFLGAFGTEAK